jgi:hypothetical protein
MDRINDEWRRTRTNTFIEPEKGPVMTREEKLNHLIEVMNKEETRANLEMDMWYTPNEEKECGYAACAMGNAGLDPLFQSMGLVINTDPIFRTEFFLNGKPSAGFDAAQQFFELDTEESNFLFDPEEYYSRSSRSQTFDNILDYVDGNESTLPFTDYYFIVNDDYDFEENPQGLKITPDRVINRIILVRDHPELFEEV